MAGQDGSCGLCCGMYTAVLVDTDWVVGPFSKLGIWISTLTRLKNNTETIGGHDEHRFLSGKWQASTWCKTTSPNVGNGKIITCHQMQNWKKTPESRPFCTANTLSYKYAMLWLMPWTDKFMVILGLFFLHWIINKSLSLSSCSSHTWINGK